LLTLHSVSGDIDLIAIAAAASVEALDAVIGSARLTAWCAR